MKKLFKWISNLFINASKRLWNSLSKEEQQNLIHGSGVIAIINKHLAETPSVILLDIQAEYPDFDLQKIIALVNAAGINVEPGIQLTVESAIAKVQDYLKKHDSKVWEWASSALAELLTVLLNPSLTTFQKVSILIEYAYNTYIKKI